jgi:hypothetical protein
MWKFGELLAGQAWFSSILNFRTPDNDLLEADPFNPFVYPPAIAISDKDVQKLLPEAIKHASALNRRTFEQNKALKINCTDILFQIFHDYIYKARAAWCWYGTESESALMWKVFAKEGIAIQTTLANLAECLPPDQTFEIGAIRYHTIYRARLNSFRPERDSSMLARPYFLKCDGFQDEHELRVVTNCPIGESRVSIPLNNTERLVHKIIVSPYVEGGLSGYKYKKAEIERLWRAHVGKQSIPPILESMMTQKFLGSEKLRLGWKKSMEKLKKQKQSKPESVCRN